MRTFAIVNRKGGVGKTTTAVNLAYVLATSCRMRVLLIDADGQANATGILLPKGEYAGLGALLRGYAICYDELTVHTDVEGLDVLPASEDLWALDLETVTSDSGRSIQPTLRVAGVLFNQWHRAPVVDDAMTTLREECPVPIFGTVIRRTDKVPESSWAGRAVQAWSPWCSAARDYRAWVAELLEKEGMVHE